MTNRQIFNHIILERECIKNRVSCDGECKMCKFGSNLLERYDALSDVLEILKSRDPQLYFASTLEQLKGALESEGQS